MNLAKESMDGGHAKLERGRCRLHLFYWAGTLPSTAVQEELAQGICKADYAFSRQQLERHF
jgi:hypothetical protein